MRFLKIAGIVLLVLILLPVIAVTFFGGSLAKQVVKSVNKNFQTEIVVADYDVSFWSSFPDLAVNLEEVQVAGSDGSRLLDAERVAFLLDLGSLFGKVRIEEIVVEDGSLLLLADVDGNVNYQLAGYTPVGGEAEEATEFAIADARFVGVELLYRDAQLEFDLAADVERLNFSGDFGADNYLLDTEGKVFVHHLDQAGERYVFEQQLLIDAATDVNNVDGTYTFAPLEVSSGDLELSVVGTMLPTEAGLRTDLRVESQSGNLDDVIKLIPPAYVGTLAELDTRGELALSATVVGDLTPTKYPRIEGKLDFTDGRVGSPRTNIGAKDLNLRALFTYLDGPRGGVQNVEIEELSGKFRGEPFNMSLKIEDLNAPRLDLRADGAFALGALPALLEEGTLADGEGYVRVEGLRLSGKLDDMTRPRGMARVAAAGYVVFDDAAFTYNDRELSFPAGTLTLADNGMTLAGLQFEGAGSEVEFSGTATNLIPVLFADSLNSQDAELVFKATIAGESLDLDELIALGGPTEAEEEAAAEAGRTDSLRAKTVARRTLITDLLRGTFEADLENWNYGEIEGEDFRGQLIFEPGTMDVRGLTKAMEGELKLDGEVYFAERLRMDGRIKAIDINVEEFFAQSENFDQEFLTADNLEGTMNANLFIQAYFDAEGNFDYEKLRVLAGISIEDGELHDFEMLENFAFALKSGDLERVRFTRLENYFEIVDETIYIPQMFIQSSALNLELSGSHTFNQYLDYYIKVNAGQAITNKISRHDRDLEVLPARRRGFFNLYYTTKGPLEDYVVESNKRAVKDDFRRSQYRKKRVREELERLFAEPIALVEDTGESEDQE